ncbi:MAG: DNA recombination protein RmuC [Phascolarctobacterium sp.]|uniref:DNA recombination protein RmuC n=1 Tax=Phascolarctobacterium sp. TaxID=2049039 RepID=UPI0026DA89AF|nr:DNA recombination protein RmuC [Phascolarctobacterium sp.]MDO4922291.1 DNA recombination protein RmuC [Phascolarctobacterium sp.]
METITIILLISILVLLALVAALLWQQRRTRQDGAGQRLELAERRLLEALYDLRGEQSTLARAARMENQAASDRLSEQLDKRTARLADLTDRNLERIRLTVDERLNESLEQKFSQVSQRLQEVHATLGQVQSLSGGVDELKRILSNVKVRGTWGEMQLGNILQDILDKGRYVENAEVRPHSGLRVEYALRLPGRSEQEVLLPIDAKFPLEDYQRLQQAREAGDAAAAEAAARQLERRLKSEAKDICDKYICPPYSTDFAVMYLPCEGLFAEALNVPGLAEGLQRQYRVCVAGPMTLAALVNSLQLGFRTLAVQQRTTEVWRLLNKVKQELEGLQAALDKSGKKLDEAQAALQGSSRYVARLHKQLDAVQVLEEERHGA